MASVKKHRYKLFLILAAVWMVVIFINSSLAGDASSGLSDFIIGILVKITLSLGDSAFLVGFRDMLSSDVFHTFLRKCAHFVEFGILGVFFAIGFGIFQNLRYRVFYRGLVASAAAILYAVTDEIHQLFVPGRVGAVTDVLIDGAGVAVFVVITVLNMLKGRKNAEEKKR